MASNARPARKERDLWTLRAGDLPPAAMRRGAPRLQALEENPLFRFAVSRRRAVAAVDFAPAILVLWCAAAAVGGWAFYGWLGIPSAAPGRRSLWFAALSMSVAAFAFAIILGVLQSESLHRMRFPAPDTLLEAIHLSGLKGAAAGSALWGVALSARVFWARAAAEAVMVAGLAALPFMRPDLTPLYGLLMLVWFWWVASAAMSAFLPEAALPSVVAAARRWRVRAQAAGEPPRALGLRLRNGFDRLLLVSCNAALLGASLALPLYILLSGSDEGVRPEARLAPAIACAVLQGLVFGLARGAHVRRRRAEYLAMLDEEMEALIELRLAKLIGEPPPKPPASVPQGEPPR